MGLHPQLFSVLREREIETQLGLVQMNCEMCKFRLAAAGNNSSAHEHGHHHHHDHSHPAIDPYADIAQYHQRIWQTP